MPSEYVALVAALRLSSYPVAEYGWKTRPEGSYLVTGLDFESTGLNGSGLKTDRSWSGSVDAFFRLISERDDIIDTVEEILAEIFGDRWEMNSLQHETETGMFHIEWTFTALDTPEEEPETPAETAQTDGEAE